MLSPIQRQLYLQRLRELGWAGYCYLDGARQLLRTPALWSWALTLAVLALLIEWLCSLLSFSGAWQGPWQLAWQWKLPQLSLLFLLAGPFAFQLASQCFLHQIGDTARQVGLGRSLRSGVLWMGSEQVVAESALLLLLKLAMFTLAAFTLWLPGGEWFSALPLASVIVWDTFNYTLIFQGLSISERWLWLKTYWLAAILFSLGSWLLLSLTPAGIIFIPLVVVAANAYVNFSRFQGNL